MYNLIFRESDEEFDKYLERFNIVTINSYDQKIVKKLRGHEGGPFLTFYLRISKKEIKHAINLKSKKRYKKENNDWVVV